MARFAIIGLAAILPSTLGAQAVSEFAGSRACAGCHKKLFDEYVLTAMGRSMSPAASAVKLAAPVTIHDPKFNRHYEVFLRDGVLYQVVSEQEETGGAGVFRAEHKLEWAVGSGVNGFSFALRRGEHLFQAPLSYYSRRGEWALSPGYEHADQGFSRPLHAACIACHSGRPNPVAGREARYAAGQPFDELAIGCENCHGPGRSHAARRGAIVNPAKLPRQLADDICMNCHQTGDTRVTQPGRSVVDFRPGRPLRETVAIFRLASRAASSAEADLLEHHEAMKASRCFAGSGGKLSCLSCHNPHRMPGAAAEKVTFYRQRCVACHTPAERGCRQPLARRTAANGNDCAACHMPRREIREIAHSALTQHRISLRPQTSGGAPAADPALPGLIYLNGPAATLPVLTRLRAYGELMAAEPALTPHYLDTLEQAAKAGPDDPLVLSALGRKALREGGRDAEALTLLERAVARGASSAPAHLDLAEALGRAGRDSEAVARLEQGLALEPFSRELRKALILRWINARAYDKAREGMRNYLAEFPEDGFMRGLLKKVDR